VRSHAKASTARSIGGRGIALAVAAFTLLLLLVPALASAITSRVPLGFSPIDGSGTGVTLHFPSGLAVDETNGNLFLNDGTGAGNVTDIFGAEGGTPAGVASPYRIAGFNFANEPSGVAVDNSATSPSKGAVYVTDVRNNTVKRFVRNVATETYEQTGVLAPSDGTDFHEPLGVATDSEGNVFVGDWGSASVVEFSPGGVQLARVDVSASVNRPSSVALDADGDLFVQSYGSGSVYEYPVNGSGEFEAGVFTQVVAAGATGIAVDTVADQLFVGLGNHVTQYDATTLAQQLEFGAGRLSETTRIAVNSTTGGIYVSDRGDNTVEVFGGGVKIPGVSTSPATGVTGKKAILNGVVNPDGLAVTECRFDYGTTTAYGSSVPCAEAIPNDGADHPVSAALSGLGVNTTYHFRIVATNANGANPGSDRTFTTSTPVVTGEATAIAGTAATLNGTVNPEEVSLDACEFEYGTTDSYGSSVPCAESLASIGMGSAPVPVHADLSGLSLGTSYHFRLSATNADGTAIGADATFTTTSPPLVETTGTPLRTATTAQLLARVDPFGAATSYHFEYGPTDAYGQSTPSRSAGAGNQTEFVSEGVADLQPNTTYHYRIVADNGHPSGLAMGGDMTVTTRASDAPLTHGAFPGPAGSDRAWEQVSVADTGGNGVETATSISDNGDRAIYTVNGGTPVSEVGSSLGSNQLFAERTPSGWQYSQIYPRRTDAEGNRWENAFGPRDLSQVFAMNFDATGKGVRSIWRLTPGAPAELVYGGSPQEVGAPAVAADGSRVFASLSGEPDPEHPAGPGRHLYDITSGSPHLVDFLPDGSIPACAPQPLDDGLGLVDWIPAGGSHVFFESGGNGFCDNPNLYVRDLEAEVTTLIAPRARIIRSVPGGVFFATLETLVPEDEGGKDVYRFDLGDESLDCVTCVGTRADVETFLAGAAYSEIAVAPNGSRVYFTSSHRLVRGAAPRGLYRIDVASGDLAYVAPLGFGENGGSNFRSGNAISPDGSFFVFRSSNGGLNALHGPQNGGTAQYYMYDDEDRSLVCVSCPSDGSAPRGEAPGVLSQLQPLTDDGNLVFATTTALVDADQNTTRPPQGDLPGVDVYEWRDGRPLLVTDGLAVNEAFPQVIGITPSGQDLFFTQTGRLTPDSIDSYSHVYDARIGGGFEFPTPPPPCPLEACQGTPKGVPEEPRPGSLDFSGAGNTATGKPSARCRRGKVRRRGRCVAKHSKRGKRSARRANNDRRASR
jgi:hypothetical protein